MVLLKLKGPRRRESERVRTRQDSNPAIEAESQDVYSDVETNKQEAKSNPSTKSGSKSKSSMTTDVSTNATPRKVSMKKSVGAMSPGDTIEVRHRPSKAQHTQATEEPSQEVGPLYEHERVMSPIDTSNSTPKKKAISGGKAPAIDLEDDVDMLDADDAVDEYDVRNDQDHGSDEDNGKDTMWYKHMNKVADDVITISSDDDRDGTGNEWEDRRPWRHFDEKTRYEYEMMYSQLTNYPMDGDWSVTEDYQREKDKEMMRYMEDFPLQNWVVPQHIASEACNRLMERTKWRTLGIRIYGQHGIPGWSPGSAAQFARLHATGGQIQMPAAAPSKHHPRDASFTSRFSHGMMPSVQQQHSIGGLAQQHLQPGMPQLPPHQVLRSQPHAQPVPTHPNGLPVQSAMARSSYLGMAQPQTSHFPIQHPNTIFAPPPTNTASSAYVPKRKSRKKADSPSADFPPAPPPTPPYEMREKPEGHASKGGRRSMRRPAEAEEFPWNREIDFKAAKNNARWDESIYDPATLKAMEDTRARNEAVIARIDQAESERQRRSRTKRKTVDEGSSEIEQTRGGRRKSSIRLAGDAAIGDPYHSGHFEFSPKIQLKLAALGEKTPTDIMEDVEEGRLTLEECGDITICWNPGKKAITQDLEQARFSIKDTILTRQQLAQTPVLIKRAAECIVDFCPDMLWRGMLLRIASEAGYGNKQVRDRMCLNGNYCDKATITKRIGSALGQKQQAPAKRAKKPVDPASSPQPGEEKIKGYTKGEEEYYNENVEDFGNYVGFFGHRASHRSQLQLNQTSSKRKAAVLDADDEKATTAISRKKEAEQSMQSPEAMDMSDEVEMSAGEGEDSEGGNVSDADAVSIQSDTLLDEIEDD